MTLAIAPVGPVPLQVQKLPLTRIPVSEERAGHIRERVRSVDAMSSREGSRIARCSDAAALLQFLEDPAVHAPIYTLPRPLTLASVESFIQEALDARTRGEGLLFLNCDEAGEISGYSDVTVWPHWAAGELGGALRPDRQSKGEGAKGAALSFGWMFDALDLDLICETAALDNVRTARLLDGLGFKRMGDILSTRPDGTTRPSRVWEITRAEWKAPL